MTDLRTAAWQAVEACEQRLPLVGQARIIGELNALRTALAEPVQDAELSAALGWPGGVSTPELDRARLLQMVATLISQRDDLLQALKKIRGFTVNGAVVYAAMVDINAVASRAIKAAEAKE